MDLRGEIMELFKEFHDRGKLSKNLCASFIVLILKKEGVDHLRDFRPISLIGSIYKILAKVLAIRLQHIFPTSISSSQGAFVKGKQILDGVLIASECIHSRHGDKSSGLICKLDFEEAYDRVGWNFLSYLLRRMGFGNRWRKWIQECISSASFSILFNGSPKGFIKAKSGLRQSDPPSPFLFVIVGEALSKMLSMAVGANLIGSFKPAREAPMISNFQFADDNYFL